MQFRAPAEVVIAVLRASPAAAAAPDMYGSLPLHVAAEFRASAEVVDAVLRANPAAAAVRNTLLYHEYDEVFHSERKEHIGKRWRKRREAMARQMFEHLASHFNDRATQSSRLTFEHMNYFNRNAFRHSTDMGEGHFDKIVQRSKDRATTGPPSITKTDFIHYVLDLTGSGVSHTFKIFIREPHERVTEARPVQLSATGVSFHQMDISDEEHSRLPPDEQADFEVLSPGNLPIHLALETESEMPLRSDLLRLLIEPYPADLGPVQPLLERYSSRNHRLPAQRQKHGMLPLHMSLFLGQIPADVVGLLICPQACVDQANKEKQTPLHIAIECADVPMDIMERLIMEFDTTSQARGEGNAVEPLGAAPLSQLLMQARERRIDQRKIDKALDSNDPAGGLEKMIRAEETHTHITRVLLARDRRGCMPLHVAVGYRRVNSPTASSMGHDTMIPSITGSVMSVDRVALVKLLLEKEACMDAGERPVRQTDGQGDLPLHLALSSMSLKWVDREIWNEQWGQQHFQDTLKEVEAVVQCLQNAYPQGKRVRYAQKSDNILAVNLALQVLNEIAPENEELKVIAERIVELLMVPLSLAIAEARDSNETSIEVVKRILKYTNQNRERNCRGELPLFTALAEGCYRDLPEEQKTVVEILPESSGGTWGNKPISFGGGGGQVRQWPYVAKIDLKEYRPSEESGAKLRVGAKLLSINNVLVDGMTFAEAKPLLKERPLSLTFACPRYRGMVVWRAVYELLQDYPEACLDRGNVDAKFESRPQVPNYPLQIATKAAALPTSETAEHDPAVSKTKNQKTKSRMILRRALDIMADEYEGSEDKRAIMDKAVERAATGDSSEVSTWAKEHGTILARYRIETTVHRSATCKVCFAFDVVKNKRVALKFMKDVELFKREVDARVLEGMHELCPTVVIALIGWHTPEPGKDQTLQEPVLDELRQNRNGSYMRVPEGSSGKAVETFDLYTENFMYKYMLVMKCGERSLHDKCAKGRIAGYDLNYVRRALASIAKCIKLLHEKGLCHGDVKQRNLILELDNDTDPRLVLCDMDASAKIGQPIGKKTSSAYCPPELAKLRFQRNGRSATVEATPSFDIWSFGVVIFELCAGRTLFSQDIANDELVEPVDRSRLCVWHTISAEELLPVLAEARDLDPQQDETREDCKNLIRWCLKGNPSDRPKSIDEILQHRFFTQGAAKPKPMPMKYRNFMSHAQKDASGTVAATFLAYKQLGVHNWLDMRQENLTLQGMQEGVRDSDVFLLVLTAHVLTSWYCQKEMLCALEEGKQIQLLLEEEPRFFPFDVAAWTAQAQKAQQADSSGRQCANISGKMEIVPQKICEMIDEHLPSAITYRRRDFEARSMMRELCTRNGLQLPDESVDVPRERVVAVGGATELRVLLIYNPKSAAEIIEGPFGLKQAILDCSPAGSVAFVDFGELQPTLTNADKILLVLTEGVLTPPTLAFVQELLRQDAEKKQHSDDRGASVDRLVCIYSEDLGWAFNCSEHNDAPREVKTALDNHEAMTFRPRGPDGRSRHEFPTFLAQLMKARLGLSCDTTKLSSH